MNPYNPYYFNNYQNGYQTYMSPQMTRLNQLENQYQVYQNMNQNINQVSGQVLQGKAVDSIDVVKAMDVPLDGRVIYFPKTDGTAIYTKQLQADGTSKINTYEISINSCNTPSDFKNNIVKKEDIEKIYSDISEVKTSLKDTKESIHNEINNLINRFDELEQGIKSGSSSISNKGKGIK